MPNNSTPSYDDIENSLVNGAKQYFEECRQRIPMFTKKYFAYPGCWKTNSLGLGWDMLRVPLNLFYAPVYLLIRLGAVFFGSIGWNNFADMLRKAPAGFTTRVQRHIAQLVYSELMQRAKCGEKPDRFKECILAALEEKIELTTQKPIVHEKFFDQFDSLVEETLDQYNVTRTASSDITNIAASTFLGAFAFKKFTPGGLGLGFLIAAYIAKESAEKSFIFGDQLGKAYYHLFPPTPSTELLIGSTLLALTVLALFASISGLISDPIQYRTRLHHLRLRKMIDNLEKDFVEKTRSRFHPKDQYIARVLDIFDAIKSHLV